MDNRYGISHNELAKLFVYCCNEAGLIKNNVLSKKAARAKCNVMLGHGKQARIEYMTFFNILVSLRKSKLVTTKKGDEIHFSENVKQIIENKKYYSSLNSNLREKKKKILENVDHTCNICYWTFNTASSLQQHYIDKHTNNSSLRNSKVIKNEVTIEVKDGAGNKPETVFLENKVVVLKIKNTTSEPISISLNHCSPSLEKLIKLDLLECVMLPNDILRTDLTLKSSEERSYDFLLGCTVKIGSDELVLIKHLTIECHPNWCKDLHASAPFVKKIPDMRIVNEQVIPGQKLPRNGRNAVVPLKRYILNEAFVSVMNSGLKEQKHEKQNHFAILRDKIINTLDVPNPTAPLNVQNYSEFLHLLLKIEEYQMSVNIRKYDTSAEFTRSKNGNVYTLEVPELSEHRPSLVLGDSVYVKDKDSDLIYQGIVHRTELDRVVLGFHNKFNGIYIQKKKFDITFGYNRTTIKMEHRAVDTIKENFISEFIFPTKSANNKLKDLHLKWEDTRIANNKEQQNAIKHILCHTAFPAPYLIFGPPGTGKTMTVVEAVMQIWKLQPDKKILVCTPSNNAANEINKRLTAIPTTDLLRYMSFSFPYQEIPLEIIKYCNYKGREYYQPSIEEVVRARIVITTLTTAGRLISDGLGDDHFGYIIIDESGHATETETLIPLAGLVDTLSTQFVLAGDPKQLGPIIHSALARKYGFDISMIERLMNQVDVYQKQDGVYNSDFLTKLIINYRSHEEIVKISNREFYDGELKCFNGPLSQAGVGYELLRNKEYPMMFHSVLGKDERESTSPSFFNVQEEKVVVDYLQKILGSRMQGMVIKEEHIGVITPYRKQVQKIRKRCDQFKWNKIMIGSVEQLQGQERMVIIISTVRSQGEHLEHDYKYHLGFLKNPKRFNVAVTRAKALLIVVGNPNLLQHDKYWNAYIMACKENNNTFGSPFDIKPHVDNVDAPDESSAASLAADFQELAIEDDTVNFSRGKL